MGCVYRRGKKGPWWIKFYRSRKPFYESSRSTRKKDAERLLARYEGQVVEGRFTGVHADRVRFEELAKDLRTERKVNGARSFDSIERITKRLEAFFGGRRAVEITTGDIRAYVAKRQEDKAAAATINRELAAIKRMFNLALQAGKLFHKPYIPMLREDNVRTGFLGEIEYLALREKLPDPINDMLAFAYKYGWRRSEVLGLRWAQVDFGAGTVRLDPGTTKNREGRTVVLTDDLRAMLQRRWQVTRALGEQRGEPIPWVFHRSGEPVRDFRGAWREACKQVGIAGRVFHDLRRSAVRNMIRASIPKRVAMTISGHKTRSVFDRYNIVSEGDLREAAKKLGGDSVSGLKGVTESVTAESPRAPAGPYAGLGQDRGSEA